MQNRSYFSDCVYFIIQVGNKKMKILLTGGAGFIGHNVTNILEQMGHTCSIFDSFSSYGFLNGAELAYLYDHRKQKYQATVEHGDIVNRQQVDRVLERSRPDAVIHLASFPRQKVVNVNPAAGSAVMSTGLINLLESAIANQVKRFVYISSSMVYGDFVSSTVSEDEPCNPQGQYGILKLAGEWLVKDYARKYGLEYTIIRPSAVYGEWDVNDRVVSKFVSQALRGETLTVNGANEVLDFTYVEDTARGIAQATVSAGAKNQTYNITRSDAREWTLQDAAELAIQLAGSGSISVAARDTDFPKRGQLDITRAQEDFGYCPTVGVEDGFQRYINWYKQNPSLLDLA